MHSNCPKCVWSTVTSLPGLVSSLPAFRRNLKICFAESKNLFQYNLRIQPPRRELRTKTNSQAACRQSSFIQPVAHMSNLSRNEFLRTIRAHIEKQKKLRSTVEDAGRSLLETSHALADQTERVKRRTGNLLKALSDAWGQNCDLSSKIRALREKESEQLRQINILQQECKALEAQARQVQQTVVELQDQRQHEKESHQERINILQREFEEKKRALEDEIVHVNAELKETSQRLEEKIKMLQQTQKDQEIHIQALEADKAELQNQLNEQPAILAPPVMADVDNIERSSPASQGEPLTKIQRPARWIPRDRLVAVSSYQKRSSQDRYKRNSARSREEAARRHNLFMEKLRKMFYSIKNPESSDTESSDDEADAFTHEMDEVVLLEE